MVEANRFAICFLSVISFLLTFKWSKEDADFFPLIFLNAFQTVLGLVSDVSEEQKLCQDVFFWVFIICLALAFSCLKASTFSAEGFRQSFRGAFLRSLIACLQASLNHGTFGSLFLEMWDFGIVWFAISRWETHLLSWSQAVGRGKIPVHYFDFSSIFCGCPAVGSCGRRN